MAVILREVYTITPAAGEPGRWGRIRWAFVEGLLPAAVQLVVCEGISVSWV
jgi:hypothetical protein